MSSIRENETSPYIGDVTPFRGGAMGTMDWSKIQTAETVVAETPTSAEQAHELIHGERMAEYGPPEDSLARIAAFWSAYLGTPIEAGDVAAMMLLLKISRETNAHKADNIIDAHAYLMIWEQCT